MMLVRSTQVGQIIILLGVSTLFAIYLLSIYGWGPTFQTPNTLSDNGTKGVPGISQTVNDTAPEVDDHTELAPVETYNHTAQLIPFWKDLAQSLEVARPACPSINVTKDGITRHDREWEPLVEKKRPDVLNLSNVHEIELASKHRVMRLAATKLGVRLPIGNGTGIVTTGGLKLFPVLLVSLRMLRRTGCELPVQVFLGDQKEYDQVSDVCEQVLPSLNARCEIIGSIYAQAPGLQEPEHFQFKVLAILFSAYEHVLFFDADAFPAHDPTSLMTSPPYTTHGLVTWPGFFANCASPHFYHIAGIPEAPVNRGTESGILLLNKEHHRQSLIMMVYYNYYGPNYYYPLQAQGGPGQGDKETFAAGAQAVNAPGPFYQVKTPILAMGNHVRGKFRFAGAAQADPIQDYLYEPPPPSHLHGEYKWNDDDDQIVANRTAPKATARAFFVHTVSQGTKLDPLKLLRKGGNAYEDDHEEWHRTLGTESWVLEKFGYDVEKRLWECVQEEACRTTDVEACNDVKLFRRKVFGISDATVDLSPLPLEKFSHTLQNTSSTQASQTPTINDRESWQNRSRVHV